MALNSNTYVWLAWLTTAAMLMVLTYNPVYHILLLPALVMVALKHKKPVKKVITAGVLFGIPLLVINMLFVHQGEQVILTIPNKISVQGSMIPVYLISGPITVEGISAAMIFMLLLVNMLLAFSTFNQVTSIDNLLRILPKTLTHSTLLVALAMRFIPTITSDVKAITDAQKSRGLGRKTEGTVKKILNRGSVLIPLVVNSLERSYNLAEALESRGYSKERTRYRQEAWTMKDRILTVFYLIAVSHILLLRATGSFSHWDAMSPYTWAFGSNPLIVLTIVSLLIP